jgi:hypothetical protein
MSKEEIVARFLSREIKLIDATPRSEPKFEVGKGSFGKSGFAGKKFGKPGFGKREFGKPGFKKGGFAKSFKKPAFKSGEKMKPITPRGGGYSLFFLGRGHPGYEVVEDTAPFVCCGVGLVGS